MLLPNLTLLVRIVEKNGLAAAGRDLGLSPATVSERLAALEAHYGAKLLNRTTRSISLTDEGRLLVEGARRLLADADELEARVRHGVEKLSGVIRVSAPFDFGRSRIAPLLDAFMAEHPEVKLDLCLSDGYVDLVGLGIDIAIRFGNLKDSALYVRKLGINRRVVCASQKYLREHGTPANPDELSRHNCLLMRFGETVDHEWSFVVGGKPTIQVVRGNRIANDGALVRDWCLAGHGIALKSIWDVESQLESGKLKELLADYAPPPSALQVVYAGGGGGSLPRRVRALIDHLAQHLSRPYPEVRRSRNVK
jgi:DNA-binding transcriptional LysR family regulator